MSKKEPSSNQAKQTPPTNQTSIQSLAEEFIRRLLSGESLPAIPFAFKEATGFSPEQKALMQAINDRLAGLAQIPNPRGEACVRPLSVAFPECSDVMLALIRADDTDEITGYFNDYFLFCNHTVIADDAALDDYLDPDLLDCTSKGFQGIKPSPCEGPIILSENPKNSATCPPYQKTWPPRWPPSWCLPSNCVTLSGERHFYQDATNPATGSIRRLFLADLVWLFYFDRLGIFKILGAILDDFAIKGRFPISNGSVNASSGSPIKDDVLAVVLESMVRQTKTGLSSTVRDRNISYRRSLGWILEEGRRANLDTVTNPAFTKLFHKFIFDATEFNNVKRLATAVQGLSSPVAKTSVATLTSIRDTLTLLKNAFDAFDYGRNYTNTLSGIVWAVAGMALVRELRTTLGIPPEYDKPYEFIPAAYDILVAGKAITPSETNRYTLHRECANAARDMLLDMEVINHEDTRVGGELEIWLSIIEDKVEGYRTAYRSLTGVDIGATGTPTVEQQV
jgi:hypothetical protein